jgi:hypothetical protein
VPKGAHEWISFPDPDEERTWVFDVTFLESTWMCVYGSSCQGVRTGPAADLVEGCCTYGAHLTGKHDAKRVAAAAATLTPDVWQFADQARSASKKKTSGEKLAIFEKGEADVLTTRIVEDACIFLNRPEFPGGPGCALHRAALERGVAPLSMKPDVCWQLPLRREDDQASNGHVTSVVRQWERRDWGEGGDEFHWWCTEAGDAFIGAQPVYVSLRDELVAMTGRRVYRRLADYLVTRARERSDAEASDQARTPSLPGRGNGLGTPWVRVPHPAVRRR